MNFVENTSENVSYLFPRVVSICCGIGKGTFCLILVTLILVIMGVVFIRLL